MTCVMTVPRHEDTRKDRPARPAGLILCRPASWPACLALSRRRGLLKRGGAHHSCERC